MRLCLCNRTGMGFLSLSTSTGQENMIHDCQDLLLCELRDVLTGDRELIRRTSVQVFVEVIKNLYELDFYQRIRIKLSSPHWMAWYHHIVACLTALGHIVLICITTDVILCHISSRVCRVYQIVGHDVCPSSFRSRGSRPWDKWS